MSPEPDKFSNLHFNPFFERFPDAEDERDADISLMKSIHRT